MVDSVPDSESGRDPGGRRSRLEWVVPVSRWGWVLMSFPVASALFTLGVMTYMTGVFHPGRWSEVGGIAEQNGVAAAVGDTIGQVVFFVLLAAFNCLPPLALAVLIAQTPRHPAKGMPVVALGCLVYTVATVWLLIDMVTDDSSTSGLLLLFLPIILGALLVPFAGATALLHRLLRNRKTAW